MDESQADKFFVKFKRILIVSLQPKLHSVSSFFAARIDDYCSLIFIKLPWVLIVIALALRLAQYFTNRSLWLDESFLALNIIERSFSELLRPLDYNQGAPIAFLLLEKLLFQSLGSSEYVLRLFPLVCGITSIFLFYDVSKRFISPSAVPIALTLFAISGPLIYYSSELKQYSSDVTITLLIYAHFFRFLEQSRPRAIHFAHLIFIGAVSLWFSHPALFIITGISVYLLLYSLLHPEWKTLQKILLLFVIWLISFVLLYFISINNLAQNKALVDYWAGSFMPFPPRSLSDVKWFFNAFFQLFEAHVGLPLAGAAAFAFLIGCRSLFPSIKLLFLVTPLFLTLLASGFHKYPFSGRLLLFLTPFILMLIAEGAKYIHKMTRDHSRMIGITFITLLLSMPIMSAFNRVINPVFVEEIRPVVDYVRNVQRHDDLIYLYYDAYYAFKYYQYRYGYNNRYTIGVAARGNWKLYLEDLHKLHGQKRVWIIFSHVFHDDHVNEEKLFLFYLDTVGKRIDSFKTLGSSVYLYDLSQPHEPFFASQQSQDINTTVFTGN
jgi:Dolichyl-phosphate-mannose-protein mannosyltransferase